MTRKTIMNQLELAYSPLSNFEFSVLRNDKIIERIIEDASLYAITQRPILSFENLYVDEEEFIFEFEIHQKNNSEVLKCRLPYLQKSIGASGSKLIAAAINKIKTSQAKRSDEDKIHGFSLVEYPDNCVETVKFLVWFSPEKLLQNYWRGDVDCHIEGNIRAFLKYKVHYVGKLPNKVYLKGLLDTKHCKKYFPWSFPLSMGIFRPTRSLFCFLNLEIILK